MALEATGERLIVEHYQSSLEDYVIYLMHVAAYRFAEPFARGKAVLDFGCGSGYGSALVAAVAREVHAVDVDEDAVAHARREYARDNLQFARVAPQARLPFADGSFELVLSFQVFEHLRDTASYLAEVRRVLAPGGTLLLVTPDRAGRLLPGQRPWNRWHVREYDAGTLRRALGAAFREIEILRMSGAPEVVGAELRRCRMLKWLLLPATLPLVPDRLRVRLLDIVHALRGRRQKPAARRFDFDERAIAIGPGLEPSLNLVAIVRR